MSMDGRFIQALADELHRDLADGRIHRIYQLARADFLFMVRTRNANRNLYLSLAPQAARIHLTTVDYDRPATPTGFCMLLRKHLEGGAIRAVACLNADRVLRLTVENVNDIGERVELFMIVELTGNHANLALLDAEGTIIDSYRRISPFEAGERTLLRGFRYEAPTDGKIHPRDETSVRQWFETNPVPDAQTIVKAIRGFSAPAAEALLARAFNRPIDLFEVYRAFLDAPVEPVAVVVSGKRRYYWTDIFETADKRRFESLSALLDDHFRELGKQARTNQVARRLGQLIQHERERAKSKRDKLTAELAEARDAVRHRIAGETILSHLSEIRRGDDLLEAASYVDGSPLAIRLDRLLEPAANAEAYFRKYRKAKQAVAHLEEQIDLTTDELQYFELLAAQFETASLNDLDEMAEELKERRYLNEKPIRTRRSAPAFETYRTADGVEIVLGKNNVQNEYVTHHLARPQELWFHVKDMPGAHVVVRKAAPLAEAEIRAAANLAACHSAARMSASVPVDYVPVRAVKKIPGKFGCFVTYAGQKTIYIDPDPAAADALRNGKNRG